MLVNDYTDTLFLSKGTVRHRNPRYFTDPKPCDYVKANHKHIIDAYAAVGIPEYKGGNDAEKSTETEQVSEHNETEVNDGVQQEEEKEEQEQVVPDNWEDLPFFTQRSLARKFDPTANTKDEVVRILSSTKQ